MAAVSALVLVALAGWAGMVSEGMISNYVRWLYFRVDWVLTVIPVLTFMLWRLLRRWSTTLLVRSWICAAFVFIALATVTTDEYGTVSFKGSAGLAACVADHSAWLPGSVGDLFTDVLPNVALFAPLGYGLAALGWRWRRVLLTAALLSLTIEFYQALFTDRVCAPRDLACNALGALVGAAVLLTVCGRSGRSRQASDSTR